MITKEWLPSLPKHGRYELRVRYTVHRSIWIDLDTKQKVYVDAKLYRKRIRQGQQLSLGLA